MSAEREFRILRYEPCYRDEVIDLLKVLWGEDREKREAYLDWKYHDNPYSRDVLIYLALHEGRVVGTDSYSVSCWQAGRDGLRYLCLHGGDAVVHPEYRRQGVHNKIKVAALRDLEGGIYHSEIVMGANLSTTGSNLKAGGMSVTELSSMFWKHGQEVNELHQIARKLPLLPTIWEHLHETATSLPVPESVYKPFRTLDDNYNQHRFGGSHIVLKEAPAPEAMAGLVNRRFDDGRIKHVRDEQFYAWRYRNPLSAFRFLFWEDAGSLEGYLVLQKPDVVKSDTVRIVDWEVASPKIFSDLLDAVTRFGGFGSIRIWSVTLPDNLTRVLQKLGFAAAGESRSPEDSVFCPHLLVIPLCTKSDYTIGGRNLLDIEEWDLRPIYSDEY